MQVWKTIWTRCKIFLFLFQMFLLSLSSSHFQITKLIKLLFTEYKSKLIRVAMVTIYIQLTVPIVLWITITVTLMFILFKMSRVIIYHHNQLKCLSWIDFSYVFNVGLRPLIHNSLAISPFLYIITKILINNFNILIVLTFLCDFSMLCFKTCDVWSLPLWFFVLSIIQWALSST